MKTNGNVNVQDTSIPVSIKEMSREQLEVTLLNEIRLKNAMQEFIIKENLSDDFDIWYKKK